jgi:hypothetical protein
MLLGSSPATTAHVAGMHDQNTQLRHWPAYIGLKAQPMHEKQHHANIAPPAAQLLSEYCCAPLLLQLPCCLLAAPALCVGRAVEQHTPAVAAGAVASSELPSY